MKKLRLNILLKYNLLKTTKFYVKKKASLFLIKYILIKHLVLILSCKGFVSMPSESILKIHYF